MIEQAGENSESMELSLEIISKNYEFLSNSKTIGFHDNERLNYMMSTIKFHNTMINDLKKTYENSPSKEIEEKIKLNESLKSYFTRKAVTLYARYFTNMPKGK